MAGQLEQLEQEIADQLAANPFFADIDIYINPQKNIVAELEVRVAKIRQVVVPFVFQANVDRGSVPAPYLRDIKIDVGCFVNPKIIDVRQPATKTALQMAEEVHKGLYDFRSQTFGTLLVATAPGIDYLNDAKLNGWRACFTTQGGLSHAVPKVANPVLAGGALTCATPGAAIFYTVAAGGIPAARPAPRNGALALGKLALPAGSQIKAQGWLAGYLSSDVVSFTV